VTEHETGYDPVWSGLLTALCLSLTVLLAVLTAYGVLRYDVVTKAEAAAAAYIPVLARQAPDTADTAQGRSLILGMEAADPGEIDEVIKARRKAELEAIRAAREAELEAIRAQQADELAAMREERYAALSEGGPALWGLYADAVLVGDSRVVGFSYYGFLPEGRVLAELGATILGVSGRIGAMRSLDPAYVILSFGANDLVSYLWPTGPEYAARYGQVVAELKEALPDAMIVVNSIPAIRESSLHTQEIYYRVPEFNDALRQMCAETGAVFVDNDAVADAHTEMYAGDGIHFAPGFYPYWGANIMESILEAEEDALPDIDDTALPALDEALMAEMEAYGIPGE